MNITAPTGGDAICTVTITSPPPSNIQPSNFTFTVISRKWSVTNVPNMLTINRPSTAITVVPTGPAIPAGVCAAFTATYVTPLLSNILCFLNPTVPQLVNFTATAVGVFPLQVAIISGDVMGAWVPSTVPLLVTGGVYTVAPVLNENVTVNARGEIVVYAGSDLVLTVSSTTMVSGPITYSLILSSNSSTADVGIPASGSITTSLSGSLTYNDAWNASSATDTLLVEAKVDIGLDAVMFFNSPVIVWIRVLPNLVEYPVVSTSSSTGDGSASGASGAGSGSSSTGSDTSGSAGAASGASAASGSASSTAASDSAASSGGSASSGTGSTAAGTSASGASSISGAGSAGSTTSTAGVAALSSSSTGAAAGGSSSTPSGATGSTFASTGATAGAGVSSSSTGGATHHSSSSSAIPRRSSSSSAAPSSTASADVESSSAPVHVRPGTVSSSTGSDEPVGPTGPCQCDSIGCYACVWKTPIAIINGPTTIGVCETATLDARSSYDIGAYQLPNPFAYTLANLFIGGSDCLVYGCAFPSAPAALGGNWPMTPGVDLGTIDASGAVLSVPGSSLIPGAQYVFQLVITNGIQTQSDPVFQNLQVVSITPDWLPTVTLAGPTPLIRSVSNLWRF